MSILFLIGGQYLGIPVATLLTSAGIGGIAVALGAQDTLKTLFGTVNLLADKPFRVGDRIIVQQYDGEVEDIGLRSTKIRLLNGHQVTLPNGTTRDPVNTPPEHRANLGLAYNGARFFVGGTANYVDDAFWTDVLDSRYWGPTDSYTQINLSAGVYLSGDRVTLSIIGQNIFDEEIQQHVFGDILRRKVTGQVLFRF